MAAFEDRLLDSPGALDQLMGLGEIGDKRAKLAQQLALAQALQNRALTNQPGFQGYGGGLANALGGIANIITGLKGKSMEGTVSAQDADLAKQQQAGRFSFARALMGGGAPGVGGSGPSDAAGDESAGLSMERPRLLRRRTVTSVPQGTPLTQTDFAAPYMQDFSGMGGPFRY